MEPPDWVTEPNRSYLKKYINKQIFANREESTTKTKINNVLPLIKSVNDVDLKTITSDDIDNWYIERRTKIKPNTLWNNLRDTKLFFRFLIGDSQSDILFQNLTMKRPRMTLPIDTVLTPADIMKLVEACSSQRDRAILMMLWDTGCRISELTTLTIGRIEFDRFGAICILDGKTGRRRARLIDCVPDLQLWINMHPRKHDQDAPLFVEFRSNKHQPLSVRRIQGLLKTLQTRANLAHKPVHPHAFRHARATERATKLTEREMDIRFGWQPGSSMSRVYVHLSGKDLERKELELAGFIETETEEQNPTKPVECLRCHHRNSPGSVYCSHCSMALSPDAEKIIAILAEDLNEKLTIEDIIEYKKEKSSPSQNNP